MKRERHMNAAGWPARGFSAARRDDVVLAPVDLERCGRPVARE